MSGAAQTPAADGQRARSVVVICTKDRPDDVHMSCSAAYAASPQITLLIVDASTTDATRKVCDALGGERGVRLIYHRALRSGLARQRNEAIELCRELGVELVHFIDDDTEVQAGYFDAIERRFACDATVAGVGGIITNQPVFDHLAIRSFFLLRSRRRGSVLASGRNMLGQYPDSAADDPVDWLNGCSMSYRISAFQDIGFDDRLEGPSLGEDFHFSFRLSRCHKLAVEPAARCVHHVTPAVRGSRRATAREGAENTYRWVRENQHLGMSLPAFWWATFGEVVLHLTSWIVHRRRDSLEEVWGIGDALVTIIRGREPYTPSAVRR